MPDDFRSNQVDVPRQEKECATPIQTPSSMMDEVDALRRDPGFIMNPSFFKVSYRGSDGQHFEYRIKNSNEEITNVVTGQRDTYMNRARIESEFELKDQNGLTRVKTTFGAKDESGKETMTKQTGERRGVNGALQGTFEITFDGSGRATGTSCTDKTGRKTFDSRVPVSEAKKEKP